MRLGRVPAWLSLGQIPSTGLRHLSFRRWGKRETLPNTIYTVTPRMTPALRWAVMTAISMFYELQGTKSDMAMSINHNFWFKLNFINSL